MKRTELVKLEAALKLLGYKRIDDPLNGTRNWLKHIDQGHDPSATIRYYIWIHDITESGEERIIVEANARVRTSRYEYAHETEIKSRTNLDPLQIEGEVYKQMKIYNT